MDFIPHSDRNDRRRTGRPLSFDRNAALEKAMLAFWAHGYETTSVGDLTRAMGITAPSLYTAFGDKRRLFLEAVRLYVGDMDAVASAIDAAANSREAARTVLERAAVAFTGDDTPRGCLLASSTATGSDAAADVREAVAAYRRDLRDILEARIERDKSDALLPSDVGAAALADLVIAVMQGLSIMARDGADRDALRAVVWAALNAWPAIRSE
nr:TetR/AcrR family transcriptional regulator [Croceicoccus hydrothermalis]